MTEPLREFFAVTMTSVYQVTARGENGRPCAEKIALRGESKFPVGAKMEDPMLAVAVFLQFYIPEGGGITSFERRLEMVNTRYWTAGTSRIVALFLDEEKALACNGQPDLVPCDPRWLGETKEVLKAIGEENPTISICHNRELALIP